MDEDLKARLLAPHLAEDKHEVKGVGTVTIRALTRAEVLRLQPQKLAVRERAMVALGMVDPPMSEADVAQWNRAAPSGEIEKVALAIAALSGLQVGVGKQVYEEFENDEGAEFRVLPSAEAEDASSRYAGADE